MESPYSTKLLVVLGAFLEKQEATIDAFGMTRSYCEALVIRVMWFSIRQTRLGNEKISLSWTRKIKLPKREGTTFSVEIYRTSLTVRSPYSQLRQ